MKHRARDHLPRPKDAVEKGVERHPFYPKDWDAVLAYASERGDIKRMEEALCKGVKASAKKEALLDACLEGQLEAVRLLIVHSVDFRYRDDMPLRAAVQGGHTAVVSLLLELGANAAAEENQAIGYAAEMGNVDCATLLLDHGADANANNGYPLRWAAQAAQLPMLELLLARGADVHANHEKALWCAVDSNDTKTVALLLRHGADANVSGTHSILTEAALKDRTEIAASLMAHGAEPEANGYEALANAVKTANTTAAWIAGSIPMGRNNDADLLRAALTAEAAEFTALSPESRRAHLFNRTGQPTAIVTAIAAAGLLGTLFAPQHWTGHETQAKQLFHALREALPDFYGARLDMVDLTPFQPLCEAGHFATKARQQTPLSKSRS